MVVLDDSGGGGLVGSGGGGDLGRFLDDGGGSLCAGLVGMRLRAVILLEIRLRHDGLLHWHIVITVTIAFISEPLETRSSWSSGRLLFALLLWLW